MMSEKGNGISIQTTALILYHQVTYNENKDKLKVTPARQ
jgi:nucleoid-associated protein YejK